MTNMVLSEAHAFYLQKLAETELPEGWTTNLRIEVCPGCDSPMLAVDFVNAQKDAVIGSLLHHSDKITHLFGDPEAHWGKFAERRLPKILAKLEEAEPGARGFFADFEPIVVEVGGMRGIGIMVSGSDFKRLLEGLLGRNAPDDSTQ